LEGLPRGVVGDARDVQQGTASADPDLREKALIDPRAPKFSALRWLLHTKETFTAFRWAVSEGVQSPHVAVEVVRTRRAVRTTWRSVDEAQAAVVAAQRTQLELALTQLAALSEELYGVDPDALAAKQTIARFVHRVGGGMFPMYRPLPPVEPRPADERADGARTEVADDAQTDGGRAADEAVRRSRWRDVLTRRRTADENSTAKKTDEQTSPADERQTDDGRTADDEPEQKRTDDADGRSRPAGRRGKKRPDGRRPSGRTNGGRTAQTGGRSAGTADVADVLPLGRTILADHQRAGVRLTRDRLAAGVKAAGQTISNERASALLRVLQTNGSSATDGADETGSSAQTERTSDGGPSGTEEADENGSSADDNDDKGAN
jgi:hypothetical protein